jgi:hypothetical protein
MGLSALAWAVISFVASTVISAVMANKQKKEMEDAQAGLLIQKQGGTHPIPIVYGQRRIAPTKVWEDITRQRLPVANPSAVSDSYFTHNNESTYKSSRDDEDFLHRIDVWCQGPIQSITNIEIDDDPVATHKRFTQVKNNRPLFRALNKHGSESQSMFTALSSGMSGISSSMKGNGLAWSWNSFLYTHDTPQYYGDPKLTAKIKGLKVWDARVNPDDPTVKAWSDNPALILLDYLTADYGKGLSYADIDTASFMTVADECDVIVALPTQGVVPEVTIIYDREIGEYIVVPAGGNNPNGNGVVSQKRFTCNIALQPDVDSKENVTEILKTFKGALPFINGKYVLSMEVASSSVMSFDDSNIVGGVTISYADRSKRLNQVTVKFPNSLKGYKEDAVTWPKPTSTMYNTLLAEDSGEKLTTEAKLSGVTSYSQAEDLAEFMVRDSRNQQMIVFKTQPLALQLEPNDIIQVTTDSLDYTDRLYRVRSVKLGTDLTVEVAAQEYDPTVYPWYDGDAEPAPEYVGNSIFDEPNAVTGLTLTADSIENTDGTAISSILVSWAVIESGTSSVDQIYVGHKSSIDADYTWSTLPAEAVSYSIAGITDDDTYTVAVNYRNMVGNYSADVVSDVVIGQVVTPVGQLADSVQRSVRDVRVIQGDQDLADITALDTLLETIRIRDDVAVANLELSAEVIEGRQAVAQQRLDLIAIIDESEAAINITQTATADDLSALSSDVATLVAAVGDSNATITTNAIATANFLGELTTKYGVQLDVNGYVSGFEQLNDGSTSSFKITTDNFQIIDPTGVAGQSGTQVFDYESGAITLGSGVTLNADNITAGTINADRLSLNGQYVTVVGGALTLTPSFIDSTVTPPTEVSNAIGNIDPSVTVTRITGGKVSVGVDWSLSRATGASDSASSPFPVTVTLTRDSTTIKTWTVTEGLGGFWESGNVGAGEPFIAFGNLNAVYLDNSGSTGTAVYAVSATTLATSNFDLTTQLTAQPVV